MENPVYRARVPIVPDDFDDKENHKNHELVMNYNTNDLYVKNEDGYVNITGRIENKIKEIQDGSSVIHIVTEDTLPPVKDRLENHWYFIITSAEDIIGSEIQEDSYVYYGTAIDYTQDKNYLLIAQNIIDSGTTVKVDLHEGYKAYFYVPITLSAIFKLADFDRDVNFTIVDRIHALNNKLGTFISYDVYELDLTEPGEYVLRVTFTGSDYFTISFKSNVIVPGFLPPNDIQVRAGSTIGDQLPGEPSKGDPKYIFKGWSSDPYAESLITPSYRPESSMTLYAWYKYNEDPNLWAYYATYKSETPGKNPLGKYCSLEAPQTIIFPPDYPGYITPEGQTLTADEQVMEFIYNLITYNITYDLDGGEFDYSTTGYPLRFYNVESATYIPITPKKEGYRFDKWTPSFLPSGFIGDFQFKANWIADSIIIPGDELREKIVEYMDMHVTTYEYPDIIDEEHYEPIPVGGTVDQITSIQVSDRYPEYYDVVDVSSTDTPILMWYSYGNLMFYSEEPIRCNQNMENAFRDFVNLRDISGLENWICDRDIMIDYIFSGCTSLAITSPIESWGSDGKISSFIGAFNGTMSLETGTIPSWYNWNIEFYYKSTTGVTIQHFYQTCVPGTIIYAPTINGYITISESAAIEFDMPCQFIYEPKVYTISYELSGGEIDNPKTEYTIEDETYYPPHPYKEGYEFVSWNPPCINHGDYGNVSFIANYIGK